MTSPVLARRLGTKDAVLIGLGAMLGAGVFSAFAPAAAAAGHGLLVALAAAAVVAYCNAVSSAQLAAQYPTSGGTYVYGRELLGPWWGFAAGWSFVIGKTASCAAMALTFAAYVFPGSGWAARLAAVTAVLVLAGVNLRGITKTAALNRILVAVTVLALGLVVTAIAVAGHPRPASLVADGLHPNSLHGLLQGAGLLFFAFAGYARIATLGEEVRDPVKVIPRAVTVALAIVVVIYAAVAMVLLTTVGPDAVAGVRAPLADAADVIGAGWAVPAARAGAAVASLGALLALITGVGRTTLAMARNGDLPPTLARVSPYRQVPHHAEIALAAVVICLVLLFDVRTVIAFSSFGVLLYYFVANASACSQSRDFRRWPRVINVCGLLGCVALTVSLPAAAVLTGGAVLAAGLLGRLLLRVGRGSDASAEHDPRDKTSLHVQ
jgi:basic amino acid/polyamine antiporter, APA family